MILSSCTHCQTFSKSEGGKVLGQRHPEQWSEGQHINILARSKQHCKYAGWEDITSVP